MKNRGIFVYTGIIDITNNLQEALILAQLYYWSQRTKDAKEYLDRENEIARTGANECDNEYGWIYKSATDMANDVHLKLSRKQIRQHLKSLVKSGFISERKNPEKSFDHSLQYKVNLVNMVRAMHDLEYDVEMFGIDAVTHGRETSDNDHAENDQNDLPSDVTFSKHRCFHNVTTIPYSIYTESTIYNNFKDNNKDLDKKDIKSIDIKGSNSGEPSLPLRVESESAFVYKDEFDADKLRNSITNACINTNHDKDYQISRATKIVFYYYARFYKTFHREHPRISLANMENVVDMLLEHELMGYKDFEDYKEAIDKHFMTRYRDCDYNICHFATDGILTNRCYETCY